MLRACAACAVAKTRGDYSKAQWKKKPVGTGRCKECVAAPPRRGRRRGESGEAAAAAQPVPPSSSPLNVEDLVALQREQVADVERRLREGQSIADAIDSKTEELARMRRKMRIDIQAELDAAEEQLRRDRMRVQQEADQTRAAAHAVQEEATHAAEMIVHAAEARAEQMKRSAAEMVKEAEMTARNVSKRERERLEAYFQREDQIEARRKALQDFARGAQHQRVVLDVRGTIFRTDVKTLCHRYPDNVLAQTITSTGTQSASDGSFYVNGDPTHFQLILNFLTDGETPVDKDSSTELLAWLQCEAKRYHLDTLEEHCRQARDQAENRVTLLAELAKRTQERTDARIVFLLRCLLETGKSASAQSASNLKELGFTAEQLKEAGYNASQLHLEKCFENNPNVIGLGPKDQIVYSAQSLRRAGFSDEDLISIISPDQAKKAGITLKQLQEQWYPQFGRGYGSNTRGDWRLAPILKVFGPEKMRAAGFALGAMKLAGASARALKQLGCTVAQLKEVQYTPKALKDAGFTCAELKEGGFCAGKLRFKSEWSMNKLHRIQYQFYGRVEYTRAEYDRVEYARVEYRRFKQKNPELFSARQLLAAGFTFMELHNRAGFDALQLKEEGFTASELAAAQKPKDQFIHNRGYGEIHLFPAESLKLVGFSREEILNSRVFSLRQLERTYTLAELKECEFTFTSEQLKESRFDEWQARGAGFQLQWKEVNAYRRVPVWK